MKNEKRTVIFDETLQIEAYHFQGIMQKFPNHFHEHYVIGFVAAGNRHLTCKNQEYITGKGDMILFNPMENHACEQVDEEALDWRCLNIEPQVMDWITAEIMDGTGGLVLKANVISQAELVPGLSELHQMVMAQVHDLRKEELFYFFMEQLIAEYGETAVRSPAVPVRELQEACDYMESCYMEPVSLDQLSRVSGLNKYTLLRSFTVNRGITPYQYLSTIRVNKAKRLLEDGIALSEAAVMAGFSDQSHFTRFFKSFIGVTPKVYQAMFLKEQRRTDGGRADG